MAPKHYRHNWAVTIITAFLAVLLLVAILGGWKVYDRARSAIKTNQMAAAIAAQTTGVQACNPQEGAASAGVCAPVQTFAALDASAVAAGDPENMKGILGVDVSSFQGCSINWKARSSVAFAFVKATEGTGYTDACLTANVKALKAAGKLYGVYDFLRPSSAHSATAEAAHFVSAVKAAGANTSLPPVADVEVNAGLSRAQVRAYVETWIAYVRAHLNRSTVIVYTGAWFWTPEVGASVDALLWESAYASSYTLPTGFGRVVLWQYSDGQFGPTPHLYGGDSDWFNGTLAQLKALAGIKAVTPVKTTAKTTSTAAKTTATKPVVVNRHYNRFQAYEAATVRRYDALRKNPVKNAVALKAIEKILRADAVTVWKRAHSGRRVVWSLSWRGWRYQQLIKRAEGKQI